MVKETLSTPYAIEFKKLSSFPKHKKSNHFFELIFILEGTGIQYVNNSRFSYRKGNIFLLTPQDTYTFNITTPTEFFFLRFTDWYLVAQREKNKATKNHIEYIIQNASHRPGCILKNKVDKPLMALLVESILKEQVHQQLYHTKITEQIVHTIIIIVARNIALKLPKKIKENTGEPVLEILHFIQEHIYEPKMLKAERIGKQFGISLSYLGRYFKNQTGETLQHYIANYKLRLVETKLLHSDMRINEIAYELHFTDESHLNRMFKKHKGMNPSAFRKFNS